MLNHCLNFPLTIRKLGQNHRVSGEAIYGFDSDGQNRTQAVSRRDYFISVQYTVQMRKKKKVVKKPRWATAMLRLKVLNSHAVLLSLGRMNGQW